MWGRARLTPMTSVGQRTSGAKTSFVSTREFRKLVLLTAYFAVLGVVFYSVNMGQLSWYVILASAHSHGVLSASGYALGLAMISFSFIVSPPLINVGYRLADRMRRAPPDLDTRSGVTANQVVVAGYGYVGRAICEMLDRAQIPYTAFEVDPELLTRSGRDVHYGDLGDPYLLSAIDIRRARLVIVTTMRHDLAKRMIGAMRQFYPQVPIMTAVQFLAERDALRRIGAEHVVALVPEGVLAFGRSVLGRLDVAADRTESIASALRSNDYAELRAVPETDTTARSAPDGADARFASTVAPKSVWDRLRGALRGRGRSVAPP